MRNCLNCVHNCDDHSLLKISYINHSFTWNSYLPATATTVAVDGADVSTLTGNPPTLPLLATNKLPAGAS